jgi:hypothetical protein
MTSDDNKKPFDEITRLLREVPQSGLPEYQIAGLETYLRAVIEFIGRIIENNNILHQIQSVEQTSDIQEYVKSLVQTIKAVKGVENAIARDRILEMREAGELLDLYPIITAMLEDHTYARQALMLAHTPMKILDPIMQELEAKGGGLKLDFLIIELQLSKLRKRLNKPSKEKPIVSDKDK